MLQKWKDKISRQCTLRFFPKKYLPNFQKQQQQKKPFLMSKKKTSSHMNELQIYLLRFDKINFVLENINAEA